MRFDDSNRCTCRRSSDLHKSSNGSCRFCFDLNNIEEKIFAEYGDIGVDIYRYLMQFDTPTHQSFYPGWAQPDAPSNAMSGVPVGERSWIKFKDGRETYITKNSFHAMLVTRREMMKEAATKKPTSATRMDWSPLMEGDYCPDCFAQGKLIKLVLTESQNCSCHCSPPPCPSCEDVHLECRVCDFDSREAPLAPKRRTPNGARKHPNANYKIRNLHKSGDIERAAQAVSFVGLDVASQPDVTAYWHSTEGPINKERYEQLLPQAIGPLPGAAAPGPLYVCKDMAPESGAPGMMFGESVWCATASPTVRWGCGSS